MRKLLIMLLVSFRTDFICKKSHADSVSRSNSALYLLILLYLYLCSMRQNIIWPCSVHILTMREQL